MRFLILVFALSESALTGAHVFSDLQAATEQRQPAAQIRARAEALCNRLSEVKVLPFKGEEVDDTVYDGLKLLGGAATKCLIDKITDTRIMPDPRKAPKYTPVRVGDVAFWILVDLRKLPYDDMFPEAIRQRLKNEGVYAYFDFVKSRQNRRLLQQNVRSYLCGTKGG